MIKSEKGNSLIEVLVALALLGTVSVLFLGGAASSTDARVNVDTRSTAKILAESIIDSVKKMDYDTSYNITIPNGFATFSANLTVDSMANGNIQELTVTVSRFGNQILQLQDYKMNR